MRGYDSPRVSPFGHLRIKGCLRLPEAFRSLPRPSSLPGAKASTLRPLLLDFYFQRPATRRFRASGFQGSALKTAQPVPATLRPCTRDLRNRLSYRSALSWPPPAPHLKAGRSQERSTSHHRLSKTHRGFSSPSPAPFSLKLKQAGQRRCRYITNALTTNETMPAITAPTIHLMTSKSASILPNLLS